MFRDVATINGLLQNKVFEAGLSEGSLAPPTPSAPDCTSSPSALRPRGSQVPSSAAQLVRVVISALQVWGI